MWKCLHYGMVGLLCLLSVACGVLSLSKFDVTFLYPPEAAKSQLPEFNGGMSIFARDQQLIVHWEDEDLSQRATAPRREYSIPGLSFTRDEIFISPYKPPGFIEIYYQVLVSFWFLSLVFAVYPVIFFICSYRRRRMSRLVLQPCMRCGYDLQGNESGACPECGRATESV